MPIIAIINPKGGVGKTTIATNVAVAMSLQGLDVLLVDSDPQGSTTDWKYTRDKNFPEEGEHSNAACSSLKHDHVIIDCSARFEPLTLASLKVADAVIIPVRPSALDLWVTRSVVALVKAQQETLHRMYGGVRTLRCALCVTQKMVEEPELGEIVIGNTALDMPVLPTRIHHRPIYMFATQHGKTAVEIEPEGEAAKECIELTSSILAFITESHIP